MKYFSNFLTSNLPFRLFLPPNESLPIHQTIDSGKNELQIIFCLGDLIKYSIL